MPATCVPWNEACAVERELAAAARAGAGKARATITFGVVNCVSPLGKPGGYWKPARVEERVRLVDAVVDDADLDPFPARAGRGLRAASRRSRAGCSLSDERVARGSGRRGRRSRAATSCGSSVAGALTVRPSRTIRKRCETRASGIARRSCGDRRAPARASRRARYAPRRARVRRRAGAAAPVARGRVRTPAASGGSRAWRSTRSRPRSCAGGNGIVPAAGAASVTVAVGRDGSAGEPRRRPTDERDERRDDRERGAAMRRKGGA